MSEEHNRVTFVLTGGREGYSGVLGGRYGFNNGELKVDQYMREPLRTVLCTRYACNIKGEAPLWKTVTNKEGKKASVQVTALDIRKEGEVTPVMEPPKATVKVEVAPKVEANKPKADGPSAKAE